MMASGYAVDNLYLDFFLQTRYASCGLRIFLSAAAVRCPPMGRLETNIGRYSCQSTAALTGY